MFGNDDTNREVDAVIMLGEFTWENGDLSPKTLVCRLTNMLSNAKYNMEEKDVMAKIICRSLRYLDGQQGYEMYRFGGSLDKVSYETDPDILQVLKDHEGSLPRHVRTHIIMRDVDRYWFGYSQCNP